MHRALLEQWPSVATDRLASSGYLAFTLPAKLMHMGPQTEDRYFINFILTSITLIQTNRPTL